MHAKSLRAFESASGDRSDIRSGQQRKRTVEIRRLLLLALTAMTMTAAHGQAWPTKPIRLLSPFPAGTPGDTIARLIQPHLQKSLGQPVIVDNRPGAGGNIGAQEVARSTDGHTFLVSSDTILTLNPHLYKKLTFNAAEDLVPVTYLARFNQVLVCNPGAEMHSLQEFTARARSAPFSYASGGQGVAGHMAMELLLDAIGARLTHVPYKGPGPAAQDVIGGAVPCGFLAGPVVTPFVQSRRLVALAVSGSRRSASLPNVPTVAEAGVPGFEASFYEVVSAPRATPAAVVHRLQREIAAAMNQPDVKAALAPMDPEILALTPENSLSLSKVDLARWGKVNDKVHLQLD